MSFLLQIQNQTLLKIFLSLLTLKLHIKSLFKNFFFVSLNKKMYWYDLKTCIHFT
jgi:hypothetical protein